MSTGDDTGLIGELRAFLDVEFPRFQERWGADQRTVEARRDWQARLDKGHWAAPSWPVEHGGRGLRIADRIAIEGTLAAYGAPEIAGQSGVKNIGPTILHWGTEEHRAYLPKMRTAEEVWCQGFSEPEAGSDLAGLRCRAVRDGDHFVVDGQKIWVSHGLHAKRMMLLARTDPDAPKHKGISAFLVDLDTPGIERRPIKQLNELAEFAEVFFTDVRVPASALIGPLNEGWKVTNTTLGHERATAVLFIAQLEAEIAELVAANRVSERAEPLAPDLCDRLVAHYVDGRAAGMLGQRMLSRIAAGGNPGPAQSMIKLVFAETAQSTATTELDIAGADAVTGGRSGPAVHNYLTARRHTIAAGTSQIVRNIIAERVLGMPR